MVDTKMSFGNYSLAVLGDITDNTSLAGFCKTKEILDQLEIPYIPVFGNHDVGTGEEFEKYGKWKGQDYFDQVFWSTTSIPCKNAPSAKNFETLLKEFNFERDDKNKDYKNFSFTYGGFSFIGLDFVSREKFMKGLFGGGEGSDAVLNAEECKADMIKLHSDILQAPFCRVPLPTSPPIFRSCEIVKLVERFCSLFGEKFVLFLKLCKLL